MTALSGNYVTLLDIAKRLDSKNQLDEVVQILAQKSPVARGGYVEKCNDGTGHLTTYQHSLGTGGAWVEYYGYTPVSKGTTRQVRDATGRYEQASQLDTRFKQGIGEDKVNQLRLQEAMTALENIAQVLESAFFYSNTATNPLQFLGLAPRMSDPTAFNGRQLINGGSTTDSVNTSIYWCTWGPKTGHLIVPETAPAGIQREDKGEVSETDANGALRWMLTELFTLHVGFAMVDYRYFGRIANLNVNTFGTSSAPDLIGLLTSLYYKFPNRRSTTGYSAEGAPVSITPTIYMNATVMEELDRQVSRNPNRFLTTVEDVFGDEVMAFRKIPIIETDGIIDTEELVTGF